MSGNWSGRKVSRARARIAARMLAAGGFLPCHKCGRPLAAAQPRSWTVGHVQPRSLGGPEEPWNEEPECPRHNFSEGGRLGAAITNGRHPKVVKRLESKRDRGIREW